MQMIYLASGGSGGIADVFGANWLNVLIAVILVLGSGGGIVSYFKLRSQTSKILVDAAQGAVVVQSSVIKDLRAELAEQREKSDQENAELRSEVAELRTHLAELNSLRTRVRDLETQNETLKAENVVLQSQVRALSRIVHDQEKKNGG